MIEKSPYPPVPADLARLLTHLVRKSRPYLVGSGETAGYIVPRREFERIRQRTRLMAIPEGSSDNFQTKDADSLCDTCTLANTRCPIYPQDARHCVEYSQKREVQGA